MSEKLKEIKTLAKEIRIDSLRVTHSAKTSHIGSCLSIADILAVLYGEALRVNPARPDWPERDRFILSKGHAAAAFIAALAETGFFSRELLETYCKDGSTIAGHVTYGLPGVEVSTGSLGHGLSIGCGIALATKRDRIPSRTFVLLSDGECDEGSTWEAVLFAPQHHLDNLIAIVDYNKIQSFGNVKEVLNLEPLAEKWRSFGWETIEINGHDISQIRDAVLRVPFKNDCPSCIIAHTIKGKGVSFMENKLAWHYKSVDDNQLEQAITEVDSEK